MIRDDIKAATITAMKGGDKETTQTLRLVSAAIKNRDIELRGAKAEAEGRFQSFTQHGDVIPAEPFKAAASDDLVVTEVLQKMIKQRRESVELYRKGNREDRAAAEEAEIAVIERFLPKQLSEEEAQAKVREIIAETGATSMKDMGRVMALVKERLGASIDPARASGLVKAALG